MAAFDDSISTLVESRNQRSGGAKAVTSRFASSGATSLVAPPSANTAVTRQGVFCRTKTLSHPVTTANKRLGFVPRCPRAKARIEGDARSGLGLQAACLDVACLTSTLYYRVVLHQMLARPGFSINRWGRKVRGALASWVASLAMLSLFALLSFGRV